MTFKETLKVARANKILATDLMVAQEVEFQADCFHVKLYDKQFETACSIIEDAYLKSEGISIEAFCKSYFELNAHKEQVSRYQLEQFALQYI